MLRPRVEYGMSLQELQSKYSISFKKTLGQNLLLDENINRIMVDAAALSGQDDVIEVGAGMGALTKRIQPVAGRLLSVEIDRMFMPCLEDQFGDCENVTLFRGDILNHDLTKLVEEFLPNPRTLKLVSNLPYYITTPILFHFWESELYFERFVIMVQQEVAERLVAPIGSRNYGKLTLAAAYHADIDIVHYVPRTCFRPIPNVDSCIVRLRNRKNPKYPGVDTPFLMKLIGAAFRQRRKTLRNSLVGGKELSMSAEAIAAALEKARVDGGRRAQTLTLDEFAALALALQNP